MRGFGRFISTEGFYDLGGFPADSKTKGTKELQKYFGVGAPNPIFNNDTELGSFTKTSNPYVTGKYDTVLDADRIVNLPNVSFALNDKAASCKGSPGADKFTQLSGLAAAKDPSSRLGCGWVYNTTNPNNGDSAYGAVEGPFNTDTKGTWMWNLDAAKQKFQTSICQPITTCSAIDASVYKGLCGWCSASGKAVPIDPNTKALAYPTPVGGPQVQCPSASLITSAANCPAPPAAPIVPADTRPGSPAALLSPSTCTPSGNGSLSRDCLLQQTLAAGCSNTGTIYKALSAGSQNDYVNILRQTQAYKTYQERATPNLDESSLKSGKLTVTQALNQFTNVQDYTASTANLGLQAASQDLCQSAGSIDNYDFCSELTSSSAGPFTLDCLQKAFLRAGGLTSGASYPSSSNMNTWNASGNWSAVLAAIQKLIANTTSSNAATQIDAMNKVYGVNLDKPTYGLCIDGLTYTKLGEYKFVQVGWPYPSSPPNGQIFIPGSGFSVNGKWDHISSRNESWSQLGISNKDLTGKDIRTTMNAVGSANNIGVYPGDPKMTTTINYYIKSQTSRSYILLVGNGITAGWVGGPPGWVQIIGRNGTKGNWIEQFSSKFGNGPSLTETYDVYYAISTDKCDLSSVQPLNIIEASYGVNCNGALRGNRTDFFRGKVNGPSLSWSYNYIRDGTDLPQADPAGGCGKTLEVKYSCNAGPQQVVTAPPEAGFNGKIDINC